MKNTKSIVALLLLFLLAFPAGLALARGTQEATAAEPVELEWWICPWRIRIPGFPEDKAPDGTEFPNGFLSSSWRSIPM